MPRRISCVRLTEEAGEQRNKSDADQGYSAAGHELLHALAFCAGVIIAVAFEQVDRTPDAEAGTERDDEGLEYADSRVEKCHSDCLPESLG